MQPCSHQTQNSPKAGIDGKCAFGRFKPFYERTIRPKAVAAGGILAGVIIPVVIVGGSVIAHNAYETKRHQKEEIAWNFRSAVETIGVEKAKALTKNLGIEFFGRYSKETLEYLYDDLSQKQDDGKPLCLVVLRLCRNPPLRST